MIDQGSPTPPGAPTPTPASGSTAPQADMVKILAIVGYLVPILFFVSMVVDSTKNNPVSRFHSSQQLNLLLLVVVLQVIAILPILGWLVAFAGWIVVLVLMIIGVINAAQGKMKRLPLIGSFQLIK